jgi:glycerophosphoryl diester phosphodiesterase
VIEVFAHRGLHVAERENTLAAFRAAVELGVDGVELDVRRTIDGFLVVHHDSSVDVYS